MTISVNHQALAIAASDLITKGEAIKGVLDRLDQDVRHDVMAWGGQAKNAYLAAKQEWDATMLAMIDHLRRASSVVDDANAEYHRTDRANAGLFEGIPRG